MRERINFKMLAMDSTKRAKYVRCGIKSSNGTERGKWRNEGSKTVKMGTERDRCDRWPFSSFCMSFVLSITAIATRKLLHSKMMLVGLSIGIPRPYQADVIGQSIWIPPPVRKSPTRLCCASAAK